MTKSTFAVGVDATGREFVDMAVDKADNNHSSSDNPFDTHGEKVIYMLFQIIRCVLLRLSRNINHCQIPWKMLCGKDKSSASLRMMLYGTAIYYLVPKHLVT